MIAQAPSTGLDWDAGAQRTPHRSGPLGSHLRATRSTKRRHQPPEGHQRAERAQEPVSPRSAPPPHSPPRTTTLDRTAPATPNTARTHHSACSPRRSRDQVDDRTVRTTPVGRHAQYVDTSPLALDGPGAHPRRPCQCSATYPARSSPTRTLSCRPPGSGAQGVTRGTAHGSSVNRTPPPTAHVPRASGHP